VTSSDLPWDVVVVGAGPAGAMAARAARLGGAARVLLLDRAIFPRYKTCGGGLTSVSLAALPPELVLPVAASPRRAEFTLDGGRLARRGTSTPLLRMVNRADFDAGLVRVAVAAGVTFRPGALVRSLVSPSDPAEPVELTLSGGEVVRGRVVVGADGSGGITGRAVGVIAGQVDVGLEVEVRCPAEQVERWRDALLIDWGPLPGSYGWVFPKGEVLTVGVIGDRARGPELRAYLAGFVSSLGLDAAEVVVSSGHLTRCRTPNSPLGTARIVLAGDAAGLLEPWTREGISFALRSGSLAGAAAAELAGLPVAARPARSARYAAEVSATLGREVEAGASYLAAFARRPLLFHRLMATPPGWAVFRRIVSGETSFERLGRRRLVRLGLRLLG
jgi:geranylgeranyl reductase family protein